MSSYERRWRFRELQPTPWRNGGGSTYEIASEPADSGLDDFDWRVSIAAVGTAGPFSTFDGVDRVLVLVDGTSMQLTVDGVRRDLRSLDVLHFPGESVTTCEIPDGPTRDLNVMTRRGRVSATVELLDVAAVHEVPSAWRLVLVAVSGRVALNGEDELQPLDGMLSWGPTPVIARGAGSLAVVRLSPEQAAVAEAEG
jgi:environmental stress-induced protein Ves